jgi:hemolysin III
VVTLPASALVALRANSTAGVVSTIIYALSIFAMFATSASYHRLTHTLKSQSTMQRLDHAMIFVSIAGTYTPLCVLAMSKTWGIVMLIVVWVTAAFGFVLKLVAFDRYRVLNVALYPILGWVGIICLPMLYRRLSHVELALLVTGGVLYTAGIPVLERERPDPWPRVFGYHEIWHVFTVAAAACHFALVALLATRH